MFNNIFITRGLLIFILFIVLSGTDCFAQTYSIKEITKNKYALDNLIASIKSENCGIKRSAIYFAGKYRIKESENVLIDELKKEKEACTKILIALVLYELGNYYGLMYVQGLSELLDNSSRRMAIDLYYGFLKNDD
jgi:hypothetical protein